MKNCPPDSSEGGANPISAILTWKYIFNNVRIIFGYGRIPTPPIFAQLMMGFERFLAGKDMGAFNQLVIAARQLIGGMKHSLYSGMTQKMRIVERME